MPGNGIPKEPRLLVMIAVAGILQDGTPAFGQEAGIEGPANTDSTAEALEEIIVVAHKAARRASDVAANVTVIDRSELDDEIVTTLADALRYTPGIDYEGAGSRFGTESINVRGIGGNRVAMLIDGVPLSDHFHVGSFANATRNFVETGFIDQIEVLHGPASALYGSDAIGGVVAMRTVEPAQLTKSPGAGGRLTGSWRSDTSAVTASILQAIRSDSVSVLGGISTQHGNEADAAAAETNLDKRDFRVTSGLFKFALDDPLGNVWAVGVYHQGTDVRSDLRSLLGTGRFATTTALLGDDRYRNDIASLEVRFGDGSGLIDDGLVRIYYQAADIDQTTLDERSLADRPVAIERDFSFEQWTKGFEINLQKALETSLITHRLGFGVEVRNRETEEFRDGLATGLEDGQQTNILLGEVFPLRDFPISRTTETGLYFEDAMSAGRWSVIAALRADEYELRPRRDEMYAADYPFAETVSLSESDLSPKLGLIYRASETMEIYLQYSQGFRAPPYEDANIGLEIPLFNYRAVPNPDLRSETSDGLELGLRWRSEYSRAYLSLFRTDYDDFIESRVPVGTDPDSGRNLFQARNVSRAVIEGVEAGVSFAPSRRVSGLGVDTRLFVANSRNRETGEPLASVGPAQAVAAINWAATDERWRLSLKATYTDDWSAGEATGGAAFEPPSSTVFDVFAARRIGDRLTLRMAVTNLTGEIYWSWSDVRGLEAGNPLIPYLSRPGRNITLGFDTHW